MDTQSYLPTLNCKVAVALSKFHELRGMVAKNKGVQSILHSVWLHRVQYCCHDVMKVINVAKEKANSSEIR